MSNGLKCGKCGNKELTLRIAFSGADWNSAAGEGSGYGNEVFLYCEKCGSVYTVGYCKNYSDIVPPKGAK